MKQLGKKIDSFQNLVSKIEATKGYRRPMGFGLCRVDRGQANPEKILSCAFPVLNWKENDAAAAVFQEAAGLTGQVYTGSEIVLPVTGDFLCAALEIFAPFAKNAKSENNRNVQVLRTLEKFVKNKTVQLANYRLAFLYQDAPPQSVPSVYLKLLALSTGAAALRSLNLEGIFAKLENVAWVGQQPFELAYLRQHEIEMKLAGTFPAIDSVDKFPRYLQHIIPPDSTRILDASRVRLGAYIAPRGTVMPGASYINFNAGTLGAAIVEGRISSSVIVGAGTDIGGGASILGVLSGGNDTPITIGEECLLGANSVTGISLGNKCIVDAGVAILAGTRLFMSEDTLQLLCTVNPGVNFAGISIKASSLKYEFKAAALSGCNGMHFRIDSSNGRTMVRPSSREIRLNMDLHGNP